MSDDRAERLVRLGQLLDQARGRQRWPVTKSSEVLGLSRAQWHALVAGQVPKPQMRTLVKLEEQFDWPRGSIRLFIDGDGPEPAPAGAVTVYLDANVNLEVLALLKAELSRDESGQLSREVLRILAEQGGPGADNRD